jgi:hypothetical protein
MSSFATRHVNTDNADIAPVDSPTRIQGMRLVAARAAVFAVIAVAAALYVFALPGLMTRLATPCSDPLNSCIIAPEQVAPLARLGVTPHTLAVVVTVVTYMAILLVAGVTAVLFLRRSDDWMALLVGLTLFIMPMVFTPVGQGFLASWNAIGQIMVVVSFTSLYLLIALFPNGRFVPRWILAPILIQLCITQTSLASNLPVIIPLGLILVLYGSLIGGQIYRYRHLSTAIQRQQTKWVVTGIILTLVINQLFWQPAAWIPDLQQKNSLYPLLAVPDSFLMICALAISFAVAILRYRLYDIDVIIRRTLIYGSLTVILAGIYVAGVIGAQSVVNALAHKPNETTSPVLIVITTLVIAALFQPLRRSLQRFIDRRFYRSKYDTRKTLEAFSATLRQEVNLSTLTGQLVFVVTDTMQPEHVSLWLRDAERRQQSL